MSNYPHSISTFGNGYIDLSTVNRKMWTSKLTDVELNPQFYPQVVDKMKVVDSYEGFLTQVSYQKFPWDAMEYMLLSTNISLYTGLFYPTSECVKKMSISCGKGQKAFNSHPHVDKSAIKKGKLFTILEDGSAGFITVLEDQTGSSVFLTIRCFLLIIGQTVL